LKQERIISSPKPDDSGKKHIASFSGGKDSSAMVAAMLAKGYHLDRIIFADTGLEFQEIYDHIDWFDDWLTRNYGLYVETIRKENLIKVSRKIILDFKDGEIKVYVPGDKDDRTFDDWFYSKLSTGFKKGEQRGWPKVKDACWWMRESKVKPLNAVIGDDITYIGFAADETKRLGPATAHARFPLIDWGWTEAEALKYLDKNNLAKPIHHKFARTGCFLCPYQRPDSLRTLYEKYPDLWKVLREFDNDSPHSFNPNYSLDDIEENSYNKKACKSKGCTAGRWF
jgi:3'-phosphoadenosine 5'-phosphosulfate sulfotransferase (PAPS reductase)/FAD synthetase